SDGICVQSINIYILIIFSVYFFFQAEDGIRDATVTGVQSVLFRSRANSEAAAKEFRKISPSRRRKTAALCRCRREINPGRLRTRSEERRVGKECRKRMKK